MTVLSMYKYLQASTVQTKCVSASHTCIHIQYLAAAETGSSALVGTLGTSAETLASRTPGWASAAWVAGVLVGVLSLRRSSGVGLEGVLSLVVVRAVVAFVDCRLAVEY